MEAGLAACNFWLTLSEEQFEKIICSDEKWFVLHQSPNRKNDVFWGPQSTENVVACKKAHGAKVMAWAGLVDGKVLPIHWFEGSVDAAAYLTMLQGIDFLLRSTSAKPYFVNLGQEFHFCLKWSKRVQMGPKGSQMVKNT